MKSIAPSIDCSNPNELHMGTDMGRRPTWVGALTSALTSATIAAALARGAADGCAAPNAPNAPSDATSNAQSNAPPNAPADVQQVLGNGLRRLQGRHLRLVTDLPPQPEVDELPQVFDAAVPQWASFFGVPPERAAGWRVDGRLIADRRRFGELNLLPVNRPQFTSGYAHENEIWLVEQPSSYYRRHLLLHEGTHAFMLAHLESCGPPWLMEGTAELLGTHRWQEGRLTMGIVPQRRDETPMWGRIRLIRQAWAEKRPRTLAEVLALQEIGDRELESYAWSWALASFLHEHPRYAAAFHRVCRDPAATSSDRLLRHAVGAAWEDLLIEWQAYVALLDYGYDGRRMAMEHASSLVDVAGDDAGGDGGNPQRGPNGSLRPNNDGNFTFGLRADRGWQSTGWRLESGTTYALLASGTFQAAADARPWKSDANGVTLEYFQGKPLGQLLAAVRPLDASHPPAPATEADAPVKRPGGSAPVAESGDLTFGSPSSVGAEAELKPRQSGVLYLRVNDSPARLGDNQGALEITIHPLPSRN